VQIFEAAPGPSEAGGALGLAPNGMNVLAAAGVVEQVRDVSVTSSEWAFENQYGKVLACSSAGDRRRYGQAGAMITRAALHRAVVEQARSRGVTAHYGKQLVGIDDKPNQPLWRTSPMAVARRETSLWARMASVRRYARP
jgi:2-polyprenyl-6-methoxyphenol hydroxylase-like FAD-dependent oxidoreductase